MARFPTAATTGAAVALTAVLSGCTAGSSPSSSSDAAEGLLAQGRTPPAAADGVTVVGQGATSASPDVVRAGIGVEVTAESISEAFDRAGEAADRLAAALREQGVAGEDIQTQEFSVRTRQEPPAGPAGPARAEGYTVRNVFDVTIRDLDRVGQLLSAATDAGGEATRIQGMSFGIEDDDAQQRQAREQAVQDARAKAEQYAGLVGRELGELVSITEVGGPTAPPTAAAEAAAPPVEPGQLTVRVHVQVTWALG